MRTAQKSTGPGAALRIPRVTARRSAHRCTIAMAGALNGPDAQLGINIKNGVQLAVDNHNAANPGCQVQLKTFRHRR